MFSDGESYRAAAIERIADAFVLYREQHYVLSLYSSGLAVECILRAYRMTVDPSFDSRHDLSELFRASKLQSRLSDKHQSQVAEAISSITRLWRNEHRYSSQLSLFRFIKRGRHDRGIRGNILKEVARRAYNSGEMIVRIGVGQWTDSHKS